MVTAWMIWVALGLSLWILELLTQGVVLGIVGLGCLLASPVAVLGGSTTIQVLAFGVGTLLSALAYRPLLAWQRRTNAAPARTNTEALIGQIGRVATQSTPANGQTWVRVGGELWQARLSSGGSAVSGQQVVVVGVTGCTLLVDLVNPPTPETKQ